jgi:ribosomal protein S13
VNRAAIVIALVATFLIGASLGLMGGIFFSALMHRPPAGPFAGPGPGFGGPDVRRYVGRNVDRRVLRHVMVMPRLREALELTDEQAAVIEPLVEQTHRAMGEARDSLRARIERVLTPEQRERWRRLEERRGFPGEKRGPRGRANRALPGPEGEQP